MQYNRNILAQQANDLGFVRDTFEKVCRLIDVLTTFENDTYLSAKLALKGGTAINLAIFDFPRLSVDIDLDFSENVSREEMLTQRKIITNRIDKSMVAAGYIFSKKSKITHALDSLVFEYINAGGVVDNLKIEINYMLRSHVLPLTKKNIIIPWSKSPLALHIVAPIEIFAAKIVALINRAAVRDLYDVYNLARFQVFRGEEKNLLRKSVMLYSAIAASNVPSCFDFSNITQIKPYNIKTDLHPVLRRGECFDLATAKEEISQFLSGLLTPDKDELAFWKAFAEKRYCPNLLFPDNEEILARISSHPMAIWKCRPHTS